MAVSPRSLVAAVFALTAVAGPARADSLHIDAQANPERNFTAVQELSYEAIVVAGDDYRVDLKLRLAVHNATNRNQDTVLSLAAPRDADLVGLAVAKDGTWTTGRPAGVAVDAGHRASGTVFARPLAPTVEGDLPGVEIVAFNLEPNSTTQVELHLKVPARLRGDRWEIELPSRGDDRWALAAERRVLVRDVKDAPAARFWVDGVASDGAPYLISRPEDRSFVSWPANPVSQGRRVLDGHLEVLPDPAPPGQKPAGGRFRVYLRLGAAAAPRPDHVVVALDRSRSTAPDLHRDAFAAVAALFDELPQGVTFDALSFARTAHPLLDGTGSPHGPSGPEFPSVHDKAARERVARALDAGAREQGTDLAAALELAGERIAARGARRPLVVVITDGMLPAGVGADTIGQVFADSLGAGKRKAAKPELLFIVDEPMWLRGGISPAHPIAAVAGALGARISLESLAQHGGAGEPGARSELTDALLAAPGVLSDLSFELPRKASFEGPVPTGLVAGNFVVVRGRYEGPAPSVTIKGKHAGARLSQTLRASPTPPPPPAFVAATGVADLGRAASDGFTLPPWFGRKLQRIAQLGITWAGRGGGEDRGYLDQKIFRRYLGTRVFPRARVCYNKAIARDQTLGGRIVFEVEVGKGEVMLARVDATGLNHRDAALEACLLEAAWALEIPAGHLDQQIYRVRYPVVFNPPSDARPTMQDDPLGTGTVELLLGLQRG